MSKFANPGELRTPVAFKHTVRSTDGMGFPVEDVYKRQGATIKTLRKRSGGRCAAGLSWRRGMGSSAAAPAIGTNAT